MLRNREIQVLLTVMAGISLIAILSASFFSVAAGWITLILSCLLITTTILFTKWRYQRIEDLSEYLRRISAGELSLDVRDNREGELSILKNEIYKVTKILSEQRSLLQQDKIQLMNAISDISHQLKTPLTSMTVMADLLGEDHLPQEKRIEFVQNIQTQLERIDWLVSSLLKLSKIDAGAITFKKETVNVKKLINRVLEHFAIPIDVKGICVSLQGEEHVTFQGDENWTTEALINIVKNGIEHTGEGGKLEISFSENPLYTEIMIRDNGKGIVKEDLPYIFQRFYKGKNASDDSVGIGLAMAHSIITSQKGSVDVTSKEGKGTEFHIKFFKQII